MKKLPIGIENFEEFSTENFYYVDKTAFIAELLQNWGKVNLFTRPRRFGKTLNMSMLKCFFEIGADKALFDGLKIAQEKELCEQYQGQFPVVFLSLKSVDGLTFEAAAAAMRRLIGSEASRFGFLLQSDQLNADEKELYRALITVKAGTFNMADDALAFFAGAAAFGGITGAFFGAAAFLAALLRSAAAFFSFLAGFLGLLPGLLGGLEHGRKGHIGFVKQLEVVAGVGVAGVEIRVQLEGPLAVGAFELLQAGVLVQPEYLVALLEGELSAAFHESLTAVG